MEKWNNFIVRFKRTTVSDVLLISIIIHLYFIITMVAFTFGMFGFELYSFSRFGREMIVFSIPTK